MVARGKFARRDIYICLVCGFVVDLGFVQYLFLLKGESKRGQTALGFRSDEAQGVGDSLGIGDTEITRILVFLEDRLL